MKKRFIKQLLSTLVVLVVATAPASVTHAAGESDTYTTPHTTIALEGTSWTLEPEPTDDQEAEVADATDATVEYLASQQTNEGNIEGYGTETEWTVIAVVANGEDPNEIKIGDDGKSLIEYLEEDAPEDYVLSTDIERKMLAIAAAGEDTEDFGGFNYNKELESRYQNGQIVSYTAEETVVLDDKDEPVLENDEPVTETKYVADETLLNDDWFGIMAISAAEAEELEYVAEGSLEFILENQQENGGFSYTTNDCDWCGENSNDTAAAIVAFGAAEEMGLENEDLEEGKENAVVYLLSTRNDDGGFGYLPGNNSDTGSTSWGLIALNTLGDVYEDYVKAAQQWLLGWQNDDGGFGYVVAEDEEQVEEEPIVATPIETPVVAQVVSVASNAVSTFRAATTTAAPVEAEPSEPQTSSTVSPEVMADITPDVEEIEESSAGRIVGYVLVALALAGFLGYIFRLRSAKTE